jgi:TonB family protein
MNLAGEILTPRVAEFSRQWEGRLIGAFPLRQFLAGGESSVVFLTTYETRPAAIKLLRTEPLSADAQLARWNAAAKLSHPNLIGIFASGRCDLDGIPLLYIVMEYAEEDLSQVLPNRALTAVEVREMLGPTLSALEYIHRQGCVHAHLKPANIMAAGDTLKISSDGICRLGANGRSAPSPYDPPESANGIASPAGDVWSLGVTLVEALTQKLPAEAAELPEPFAEIAHHCLQPNPADRWTIADISKLLTEPRAPAPTKKRYLVPVAALILLALLIVVVLRVRRPDTTVPPPAAPIPTHVTEVQAPDIIDQPLPEITEQARRTIHGKISVNVNVEVDPFGAVTDAKLVPPATSKYFSDRALIAVRQWKFRPTNVEQQWRVHFEFRPAGTKVQPRRLSP